MKYDKFTRPRKEKGRGKFRSRAQNFASLRRSFWSRNRWGRKKTALDGKNESPREGDSTREGVRPYAPRGTGIAEA